MPQKKRVENKTPEGITNIVQKVAAKTAPGMFAQTLKAFLNKEEFPGR